MITDINRTGGLLLVFSLLIGVHGYAQEINVTNYTIAPPPKEKQYHLKITMMNGQVIKGILHTAGDSSVLLQNIIYTKQKPEYAIEILHNKIPYTAIKSIKVRSFGAAVAGSLAGSAIGAVVGGIVGFVDCKDCNGIDDHLGSAFVVSIVGIAIGIVGGAMFGPPSFQIGGQYENFQRFFNWREKRRLKKLMKS